MILVHVGGISHSLYRRRSKINVILSPLLAKDPSWFLFLRAMNLNLFLVSQLERAPLCPLS